YAAASCIALAAASLLLLMRRRWRASPPVVEPSLRLPLLMRLASPMALLLEPLVDCMLPRWRRTALTRQLEAIGIAHALSPQRWESLRAAVALCGGVMALLLVPQKLWLTGLCAIAGYLLGGQ